MIFPKANMHNTTHQTQAAAVYVRIAQRKNQNSKRVYALEAYQNHPANQKGTFIGLKEIYAPMGSGKTTLIIDLIQDARQNNMKFLVLSPYRTSRLDFQDRLSIKYQKHMGLDSEYLYLMDMLHSFLNHAKYNEMESLPSTAVRDGLINHWLKSFPELPQSLIVLDEIDFAWVQAERTAVYLKNSIVNNAAVSIWESIVRKLSCSCYCIGFSATVAPQLKTYGRTIYLDKADTSVRIKSLHTKLYDKNVTTNALMKHVLNETLKESSRPTLVYKSYYSVGDIEAVRTFAEKEQKKVLVIQREENTPRVKEKNSWTKPMMQEGFTNIRDEHADLKASYAHFLLVGSDDDSPDSCIEGSAATEEYAYVFISTSSSRQYSLSKHTGHTGNECRVICFGRALSATMLQVAGRFRQNPVELELHLTGRREIDVADYSGDKGLELANSFDPFMSKYKLTASAVTANWLGSSIVTTSKVTREKLQLLAMFFREKGISTQQADFIKYKAFVKMMSGSKPYGERTFQNHWRKAKNKQSQ